MTAAAPVQEQAKQLHQEVLRLTGRGSDHTQFELAAQLLEDALKGELQVSAGLPSPRIPKERDMSSCPAHALEAAVMCACCRRCGAAGQCVAEERWGTWRCSGCQAPVARRPRVPASVWVGYEWRGALRTSTVRSTVTCGAPNWLTFELDGVSG